MNYQHLDQDTNALVKPYHRTHDLLFIEGFVPSNMGRFQEFVADIGCFYFGIVKTLENVHVSLLFVPSTYAIMYIAELMEYDEIHIVEHTFQLKKSHYSFDTFHKALFKMFNK